MMIILGSSLALGNLIGGFPKPDFSIENPKGWLKILILLVVTFVYIWLLRSLGFLLLTPFYMGFLLKLFNHRDYKRIVAISLLTTIVLYLLFVKVF
ncbi:MAG: hypothetical protein EOM15_11045, partial [Spirochaetia bacterium]|nr:hypothetical protein [Spirochaetia bacterium]